MKQLCQVPTGAADQPLLGDADGDGRNDARVFDETRVLCDTRNNGGTDRSILFGQPRGSDGDGDDDPSVFRSGKLLCDTAHESGVAELELLLGQSGDRPLLADIDGL